MKILITNIEVPEQLDNLPENKLRILRDRLIVAGVRAGGVDERLPRMVEAFQAAMKRRPPRGVGKGNGR